MITSPAPLAIARGPVGHVVYLDIFWECTVMWGMWLRFVETLWDIMIQCDTFWYITVWYILIHLETFGYILIHFEIFGYILRYFDTFWDILIHFHTFWNILRHLETFWYIFRHFETFSYIFRHFQILGKSIIQFMGSPKSCFFKEKLTFYLDGYGPWHRRVMWGMWWRCVETFWDIFIHFETLSDILRHFETFSDLLRHFQTLVKSTLKFWGPKNHVYLG